MSPQAAVSGEGKNMPEERTRTGGKITIPASHVFGNLTSEEEKAGGNGPDLNEIVSQAQGFMRSLAALVNNANRMRIESVSLRHENGGLTADNQRLQKELDLLESKIALLEERMLALEHRQPEDLLSPVFELPPDHDEIKKEFLARLSLTPRDWYLDGSGYPVRDEFVVADGKKQVITFAPPQAVYYMETGDVVSHMGIRNDDQGKPYRELNFDKITLTEDDLPALKRACGIRE